MDALSEDLEKYLAEAGEEEFKKKLADKIVKDDRSGLQKWLNIRTVETKQDMNFLEPITAVFAGFGEILGAFASRSGD